MQLLDELEQTFPVIGAILLVTVIRCNTHRIYGIHTSAPHKASADSLGEEFKHPDLRQQVLWTLIEFDKATHLFVNKPRIGYQVFFTFRVMSKLIGLANTSHHRLNQWMLIWIGYFLSQNVSGRV